AQQRLWFLNQLEPDSHAYNLSGGVKLKGRLRVDILNRSLSEIIFRHETLRTTFHEKDGKPIQVISPPSGLDLPVIDLHLQSGADRQAEIDQIVRKQAQDPFDLSKGPLLRSVLLRLDQEEHILLLTMHHIITDGWSLGVLVQEMATFYEAFSQGTIPPLPPLPIQYADFAEWQREWFQGEVLESQVSYWKEQLGGDLPILALPTDRPRPAMPTYQGKIKSLVLSKTLHEALVALSQREGVTLFMTLLAAFQALLHRYTGQDDIIVGSPIANRNRLETEGLIGFFANTLVLRTDLSGNPTFRKLLVRVREMALGAYAHQDLPFERLVEELHVARDLSYNPLFQVMLVFQNASLEPLQLSGLTLTPLATETGSAKFDLTLELIEGPRGLAGSIEYNTDLFDSDTIERMAGHFQILLQGIIANPDSRLSELQLLTEAERHQLLEWNATQTDYPRDKCIQELFEEQVERIPDAVALVFKDQRLTYRELNRRANQLARHLRNLGVGPEVLVGICMERSLEMVVGLLGILKAGGAYVPLDSAYPRERLAFMVEDTRIAVLLTQRRTMPAIQDFALKMLCLDTDSAAIAGEDGENVPVCSAADNLAYVMYTSGSTGTPKGVEVLHRGVVRLVINTNFARLDGKGTFLQLAPISFDASTFELWAALLNGATCILYSADAPSTDKLAAHIRGHSVSTLWLTSSLFNAIIDEDPQSLRGVSQVLIGGEQLSAPHVICAQENLPETQIINGYGPTENTTFTCCYSIPQGLSRDTTMIPIGRPIANTEVYILDKHRQLVPINVHGELFAGGDGLARGYLNRPELTEEKFIPHPLSDKPGARIYKTGDLARYRPDGSIECLGRIDHQVKLRGFRIELGEIEARVKDIEAVSNCVVALREDRPGDRRLVAYYVARDGDAISVPDVRGYLQSKLPEYMVPQHFVKLEAIPLTPNGKVDKKVLPKPVLEELSQEKFVAPRTEIESAVASVWQQVLKVDRVSVNSNFFELGGNSLLMVQVLNRIRGFSDKDIPIMALFQHPTIASLANYLVGQQSDRPSFQQAYDRTQRQEKALMRQEQLRRAREKVNE
ncbi:MAG: amino acid adenylation domain-containing protein, partial [Syntrophobacteraceae bacterium]